MTAGLRAVRPSPPNPQPGPEPHPTQQEIHGELEQHPQWSHFPEVDEVHHPPNTLSAMTTTAGVRDLAMAAATKAPSPA